MTHRTGTRVPASRSSLDVLVALFDRANLVTLMENKREVGDSRCSYPISGVEGQETCDLSVDAAVFAAQKAGKADEDLSGPVLCLVHFNKTRFEAAGIDVDTVYDGTPYEAAFRKKAQGRKPRV